MQKPGRKRRGRIADAAIPPPPAWVKPSPVSVERERYPLDRGIEVAERLERDAHGNLIDFALVLLVTPEGEDDPIEIAKIDCRHDTVHLHEGAKKTEMRDIRGADDIEQGYTQAWDRLTAIADTIDAPS